MTEKDLEHVGIAQVSVAIYSLLMLIEKVGVRKIILEAITDLHKTQWKQPKDVLPFDRSLRYDNLTISLLLFNCCHGSIQEFSLALSTLTRHIQYVHGSTSFLLNHISTSDEVSSVSMTTEPLEQEELANQITAVSLATRNLQRDVTMLERRVNNVSMSVWARGYRTF